MKKIFIKNKILILRTLLKSKYNGEKTIISLIWYIFKPFIKLNETKKSKKMSNLCYKALGKHPTFSKRFIRKLSLSALKFDLKAWSKYSASKKSKNKISIRIDATKGGNHYGKKIPELKKLYDYVSKSYIKSHTIYLLLVSIGKKDFIVDFYISKSKDAIKSNKIAKHMINKMLKGLGYYKTLMLNYGRLSMDGGWGNVTMIIWLSKMGFRYNSIKSSGTTKVIYKHNHYTLKGLEEYLLSRSWFKAFNKAHKLKGKYFSANVLLEDSLMEFRIIIRRFKVSSKNYRTLMLLSTSDKSVHDYQIAQCYECRWGIEECFKKCKSNKICNLTKYSFHSKEISNIEMFFALRFCTYMMLNWYQVQYCRPSITSLYKVAKRFEDFFSQMGYKRIWELFSG